MANKKNFFFKLWEISDNETEEKPNNFPSFIVMESTEEIPLSKLSPFKIEKKILSKNLKPKTVKKLKKKIKKKIKKKNGTLVIEIHYKNQSEKLLKWKHFDNIKIKTYPHNSLNTCKGVMKSYKLSLCTLDEIKTNLKDQNVTEIRRIQIKKYREIINTNTYILTFSTRKILKEIKIGYQKINVEPYIPNPLRCYKCQRFGHHQDQYTRPPVYRRCGEYDIHKTAKETTNLPMPRKSQCRV